MIAALVVINVLLAQKQTLFAAKKIMQKYPQKMISIPANKNINLKVPAVQEVQRRAEKALAHNGRVLIRCSGTEHWCAWMVEARSGKDCKHWAQEIAHVVETL